MGEILNQTPLHQCHVELGARMVPFAGYQMPVQYTSVLKETLAVRTHCGLFDVSHMGQVSVSGKGALEAVNALVTNDLSKMIPGQAQYNILCNEQGNAIDDLVIYHRGEDEVYICVNAGNRAEDVQWFRDHLGAQFTLEDQSDETALLALQGPNAETLLSKHGDSEVISKLAFYFAVNTTIFDIPVFLSRTGYTGEDGYEIYVANKHAIALWTKIMELGQEFGVLAIGLGARDTLRLEMGYALHGHELSTSINPFEAGLGWVVKLKKQTSFVGQQALLKQKERGVEIKLRALTVNDRRTPRAGYPIYSEAGDKVGEITSGGYSPHLEHPIALGFVKTAISLDAPLFIQVRDQKIPATQVKLPFLPSHTKSLKKKKT